MTEFTFAPATRESAKARVALDGPSGSGKTFTSLLLADSLGSKIALIDTERGSAAKYANDPVAFDTLQMHTFDPRDLVKALASAGQAGYDVVVVDSLSHFWMGTGGMLEQVDAAAKRGYGGNSFGGWKEARPMERAMIDALLGYPGHVIVTMRSKSEWVIERDERTGKNTPRKIGMKPEQRDGIEYEFDVVGDMDIENTLVISKSRCRALSGAVIRRPDGDNLGAPLHEWLSDGAPAPNATDYLNVALDPSATFEDLGKAYREAEARNLLGASVADEGGNAWPLGDLLIQRGNAAKAQAQAQMREQPASSNGSAAEDTPPPSDVEAEDDTGLGARSQWQKKMFALFRELGIEGKEQQLAGISAVIGREIGSRTDITDDEYLKVLDSLEAKRREAVAS